MTTVESPGVTNSVVSNVLVRYEAAVRLAERLVTAERSGAAAPPVPFALPEIDDRLAAYYGPSDMSLAELGERDGRRLFLLNLMHNPGTRTTKTVASLTMIARAASHVRATGERLLVLTPTSGNKGTALRDAIARAYATGLATPDELRIVTVVPEASRDKLRACPLSEYDELRAANPVALARVDRPAGVKELTSRVLDRHADDIRAATGFRLWYTLDLDNYRIADAARAFAEADLMPITADSPPRIHAHAVSSAYGLLGYHVGHRVLTELRPAGLPVPARHPGFFLIQQLSTPDMVLSLAKGDTSRAHLPTYRREPGTGRWVQGEDPLFPAVTDDPAEVLDPTFYTSAPPTSASVNRIIGRHGGGGVVVSRRECLDRYDTVRALLGPAGIALPDDPGAIREWSLAKAVTGVLVGIERGLLDRGVDVVVHGSGFYSDELVPPLPMEHIHPVSGEEELAKLIMAAATA